MSLLITVNERVCRRQQATLYFAARVEKISVKTTIMRSTKNQTAESPRWVLLRDLGVLQFKLIIDGFRDLVLLPASIVAAVVSYARAENGVPGPEFYKLLIAGRQSEQFINLFGAIRNAPDGLDVSEVRRGAEIDDIVSRVENFVVDEYKRGGVTAQAKSRIDEALNILRRKDRNRDS